MDHWYQSAILRQQIGQLLVAGIGIFGYAVDSAAVNDAIAAIFAGIGGLIALKTIFTRLFRPSPNLTLAAQQKENELRMAGKIK
jgi:hypothetical protein